MRHPGCPCGHQCPPCGHLSRARMVPRSFHPRRHAIACHCKVRCPREVAAWTPHTYRRPLLIRQRDCRSMGARRIPPTSSPTTCMSMYHDINFRSRSRPVQGRLCPRHNDGTSCRGHLKLCQWKTKHEFANCDPCPGKRGCRKLGSRCALPVNSKPCQC